MCPPPDPPAPLLTVPPATLSILASALALARSRSSARTGSPTPFSLTRLHPVVPLTRPTRRLAASPALDLSPPPPSPRSAQPPTLLGPLGRARAFKPSRAHVPMLADPPLPCPARPRC
ncbi:hypothetical protein FS749_003453 [Ceratobasidium sp. UAMH 11750]|nr:hypothetical protein FS749_003453 [Ceratobasidium sp. UAMH 11750]